jgi:hypothetical protein
MRTTFTKGMRKIADGTWDSCTRRVPGEPDEYLGNPTGTWGYSNAGLLPCSASARV